MYKEKDNLNIRYAFAIIPLFSTLSFSLHNTLDNLTNVFFDRQLGGVILGVSIFSFGLGVYAPSLYNYFFPSIPPTIPVSPPLVEKTDSMLPSQDVFISSIPSDTVSLKITDLEFIRETLFQSAYVLTNNNILLTNILKARLSRKFTPPSNLVVRDTIKEISPVLDEVDLALKFLDNQLTITSQIDPSIVSTIVN